MTIQPGSVVTVTPCPHCGVEPTDLETDYRYVGYLPFRGHVITEFGEPPPIGAEDVKTFESRYTLKPCGHVVEPGEIVVTVTPPPRSPEPVPEIAHHAEVPAPFTVEDVRGLLDVAAPNATISVKTRIKHGGDQRDPTESVEVVALCADWTTS